MRAASRNVHKTFSSRLDADLGETAWLVMELKNISDRPQTIESGLVPIALVTVTTAHCEPVWRSPFGGHLLPSFDLDFGPGEVMRFGGEWSLTDNWGELVPPGYYHVYGVMKVDGDPTDGDDDTDAQLAVRKTVEVSRAQLRTARIGHPPTPVHPCISGGGLVYEAYVRQVMERRSDVLKEWRRWGADVMDADILDENRMPTGRRGIRVVEFALGAELSEDSALRNLPGCLDGVPVQLVVRTDP